MRIYDGRPSFYQWDTNQKITSDQFKVGDEIHFFNIKQPNALVVLAYELDNNIVVDVPNILLQKSYPIIAYRVYVDDDGKATIEERQFKVKQRPKPEDYVYTETEVLNYSNLNDRLTTLENSGSGGVVIDTTLTQSGKAADAKAVGDALAGKQPKGDYLTQNELPDMTAYRTAEAQDVIDAGKQDTLIQSGATVGQIAKITAVDSSGKPTAWEAVDMPSGGGGASYRSWSKVWTLAVAEDIAGFEASNIDLDGKSEIMIVFISDSTSSRTMVNGRLRINGVDAGKVLFNSLPLRKDSHSFVIIGRADEGIEYTTMAASAEYQTYPWQGEVKIIHRMVSGTGSTIQWIAGSTIEITQTSATLGQGVTIEIYVR